METPEEYVKRMNYVDKSNRFDECDFTWDSVISMMNDYSEPLQAENKALREALNTLIDPVTKDFYVEYKAVILAIDRKKILKALQSKQG